MSKQQQTVGPNCYVEHDPKYGTLIGDDLRMNGLDGPARIRTTQEVNRLMQTLGRLWPEAGVEFQTNETAVLRVARKLRDAWRESGSCATYSEPRGFERRCASCGRSDIEHNLLKFAEELELIARMV